MDSGKKRGWTIKLKDLQKESDDKQDGLSEYCLPGVRQIILLVETQKRIGCFIGEDINKDCPFIDIPKEKIENHISLPDQKSPFLPLKQELSDYPEETILLGYDPNLPEIGEHFFVCVTSDARKAVLDIIEKHKKEQRVELKKKIIRRPRKWTSYGSEVEIEDMMVRNFRPLIEVQIVSKQPIHTMRTKFSMRKVQDAIDGYVELLPGRYQFNNILKRRIDRAIQVAPYTVQSEAQTNPTYPKNKWTQYSYKVEKEDEEITEITDEHINNMKEKIEELCDNIRINESINFHVDDYKQLSRDEYKTVSKDILEKRSFYEVIYCKGKKVSCLAWHPTSLDIFVAAYSTIPLTDYICEEIKIDLINDRVMNKNLVLLWNYEDNMKPKLCLESHSAVTTISFCEQNPDIIIGGCENGQIIIWDITDRLTVQETEEVFSMSHRKNKIYVHYVMNWIKVIPDIPEVPPTVISVQGHSQAITGINWLPKNWFITSTGKVEYNPDIEYLQFLTCGLDGLINFWDLNSEPPASERKLSVAPSRLKIRPEALSKRTSRFRPLDRIFSPLYKLIVKDKYFVPITSMCIRETIVEPPKVPEPEEEDTLTDMYYTLPTKEKKTEYLISLLLGTSTGKILTATWEGYDPENERKDNTETCKIVPKTSIHDGPIRMCTRNPKWLDFILTIGGKTFIVWDETYYKILLWYKSHVDYVSGSWSHLMYNIFMLSRVDGYLEVWNVHLSTSKPSNIIHLAYGSILNFRIDDRNLTPENKFRISLTDDTGGIQIFRAPELLTRLDETQLLQSEQTIMIRKERKLKLHEWIVQWQKKIKKSNKKGFERMCDYYSKQIDKETKAEQEPDEFDKILKQKWKNPEEEFMYNTLLERRKLNLEEITLRSRPLRIAKEKREQLKMQQEEIIANKNKLFQYTKDSLFTETLLKKRKEIILEPLTEKSLSEIKKTYITDYNITVTKARKQIQKSPFEETINWKQLLADGRKRRQMYNVTLGRISKHPERYEEQCRRKKEALMKAGIFIETVTKLSKIATSNKVTTGNLTEYAEEIPVV